MPTQVTTWQQLYNCCANPTTYITSGDGQIQVMNNITYNDNSGNGYNGTANGQSVYINNAAGVNISITSGTGGPYTLFTSTNGQNQGVNYSRHFTIGYPTPGTPGFNIANSTVTIDNIILDGNTGALPAGASPASTAAPVPSATPAVSWGGGIQIASGTTTFGSGFVLQNCYSGMWNDPVAGGHGALCINSYFYNITDQPCIVNFSGTIQYNQNGNGPHLAQNYYEAPGGVMIMQRNGWNNGNTSTSHTGPVTQFNMTGGNISYNTSYCAGGGVCLDSNALNQNSNIVFNMTGGTISYNVAATVGGGLMVGSMSDDFITLNLSAGSINNNQATGTGTYIMGGNGVIKETGNGGGIWMMDGQCNISGTIQIWNNTASQYGGGAYTSAAVAQTAWNAPSINVSGGDWKANTAIQGAAIFKSGGPLTITGGNFHQHTSTGDGAVFYAQAAVISLNATALPTNLTPSETNNTVVAGTISVFDNVAGGNGGVVNVSGSQGNNLVSSSFTATNVLFYNNSAKGNGGVLYSSSGPAYTGGTPPTVTNTLTGCIFSKNSATNGGAYWVGM